MNLKTLWEKVVVNRYVYVGLRWGDATSYGFLGEPLGYESLCKRLLFWENKYKGLGYVPIDRDKWVTAGGYGEEYESLLRVRQNFEES